MPVEYTNQIGQTYYLREGKTKTGKPRYWFAMTQDGKGKPVDKIPEGFEIYEHPGNAGVYLRKKRPQLLTDTEKQLVEKYVGKIKGPKRYRVDCKDEFITIYESDAEIENLKNIFGNFFKQIPSHPGLDFDAVTANMANAFNRRYTAMMRFRLVDKERRLFTAERFCFKGSIDDWIEIGGPNTLKKLAKKYIKHLGTEKFFDLF